MSVSFNIFVSYAHEDEWLKQEFLSHSRALERNGAITTWHDRLIKPGEDLDKEVDSAIRSADIVILLVSADFINSDYCFKTEYQIATERRNAGETEIIPVIVRHCDWDVGNLRSLMALPTDAAPVTRASTSRTERESRDPAWLEVIAGLKTVIEKLKKKLTPPELRGEYTDKLFITDSLRHPNLATFDERKFFVEPDVYFENKKEQIIHLDTLLDYVTTYRVNIISGYNKSGKTVLAKKLQLDLLKRGEPAVLLKGADIRNMDIEKLVASKIKEQFEESEYNHVKYTILIDDFEDCNLSDRIKESLARKLYDKYSRTVIISFSSAPAVFYTDDYYEGLAIFNISQLNKEKILRIVNLWKSVGGSTLIEDRFVLSAFEKLQTVFDQTDVETSPYSALLFLGLLDTVTGSDIAYSSFAACYETLILLRLRDVDVEPSAFDESKNFLSLVAYHAFRETGSGHISTAEFDACLDIFSDSYLSDKSKLKDATIGQFLFKKNGGYSFREEYIWYFLCARYVARTLSKEDESAYKDFIKNSTSNIYLKKFANIVIFLAYHSTDDFVIHCLMDTLDRLFSKTNSWQLSDASRELMLGIVPREAQELSSRSNVSDPRLALLRSHIDDIINDAEGVVAKYTLPFMHTTIADSKEIIEIDSDIREADSDSYMRSVNALLRIHSVIGQILTTRAGTYGTKLVLDCVTRMVQASGRYASLNHAIATVLTYDKKGSISEIQKAINVDEKAAEERYDKVRRIFSFWSVYMSQAGLARYLSQDHSIRALDRLVDTYESEEINGFIPFNFTSVHVVAKLYNTGRIDQEGLERIIEKYGEESALISFLRVAYHIYAYYMPLSIQDKQWLSNKLRMPMTRIEAQRMRSTAVKLMLKDGTHSAANEAQTREVP